MEERFYKDWSDNDKEIKFLSDASQSFINAIAFNEWYVVKQILIENGYMIIEQTDAQLN